MSKITVPFRIQLGKVFCQKVAQKGNSWKCTLTLIQRVCMYGTMYVASHSYLPFVLFANRQTLSRTLLCKRGTQQDATDNTGTRWVQSWSRSNGRKRNSSIWNHNSEFISQISTQINSNFELTRFRISTIRLVLSTARHGQKSTPLFRTLPDLLPAIERWEFGFTTFASGTYFWTQVFDQISEWTRIYPVFSTQENMFGRSFPLC